MSYKNCPRYIRDIKENIKICNELVTGLEKREKEIKVEITTNPNLEASKFNEELVKIKEQISQWDNRCSENLEHLNAMRKVGEVSKV